MVLDNSFYLAFEPQISRSVTDATVMVQLLKVDSVTAGACCAVCLLMTIDIILVTAT